MINRYNGACDAINKKIEYITMCNYGKISPLSKKQLTEYQTFICATETIALQVYKQLLINNIEDYQILSAGNNKTINFVIDNYSTIDFHYKSAGKCIIDGIMSGIKVEENLAYSLIFEDK